MQGQALPSGRLLVCSLSLLTDAFKSLYCKGTSTQAWLYTDMFSSLMFCCACTVIAWPCRDDANTMEVMLNAKVPGWGKERVKVSHGSTMLAAGLLQMHRPKDQACAFPKGL